MNSFLRSAKKILGLKILYVAFKSFVQSKSLFSGTIIILPVQNYFQLCSEFILTRKWFQQLINLLQYKHTLFNTTIFFPMQKSFFCERMFFVMLRNLFRLIEITLIISAYLSDSDKLVHSKFAEN